MNEDKQVNDEENKLNYKIKKKEKMIHYKKLKKGL